MDISQLLNPSSPSTESTPPIPHPPIRRPKATELSRDQRRDIQLLRSIGWKYDAICKHLEFRPTKHQVRKACSSRPTPTKRVGRPPVLTQAQIEELVEFVYASTKNRRMSYEKLASTLNFGVKKDAIRTALAPEGFYRRLAMRKPPISDKNTELRLA